MYTLVFLFMLNPAPGTNLWQIEATGTFQNKKSCESYAAFMAPKILNRDFLVKDSVSWKCEVDDHK